MPLYSGGLWLAEICTPPAARCARTSTPIVGVAAMSGIQHFRPSRQQAALHCSREHRPGRAAIAADEDRSRRQTGGKGGDISHGHFGGQAFPHNASKAGDGNDGLGHRTALPR